MTTYNEELEAFGAKIYRSTSGTARASEAEGDGDPALRAMYPNTNVPKPKPAAAVPSPFSEAQLREMYHRSAPGAASTESTRSAESGERQAAADKEFDGWRAAAQSDPEIGGANFKESVGLGVKLVSEFGTPALIEALNTRGMGDHPELIRLLSRVGRALRDARSRR